MKKVLMGLCLVGVVFVFAGCQSSKSVDTNTDNADSAITNDASDIGNPPVPPEPTQPAE